MDLIENDFQKSEKMGALNFVAFNWNTYHKCDALDTLYLYTSIDECIFFFLFNRETIIV